MDEEEVKVKESKGLVARFFNVMKGAAASTGNESVLSVVKSIASGMEKTLNAIDKYLEKGKAKGKDALLKGKEMASSFGGKARDKAKELSDKYKEKGLKETLKEGSGDVKQTLGNIFKLNKDSNPEDPDAEQPQPSIMGSLFNRAKNAASSAVKYADFASAELKDFTGSIYQLSQNPNEQNKILEGLGGRSLGRQLEYYRSKGLDDIAIGHIFDTKLSKTFGKDYYSMISSKAGESETLTKVLELIDLARAERDGKTPEKPGILEAILDKTTDNDMSLAEPGQKKSIFSSLKAGGNSIYNKASSKLKGNKTEDGLEDVKEKKSLMELMKGVLGTVKESAKTLAEGKDKSDPKETARAERAKETQEAMDMQKVRRERRDKEIADEKEASKVKPKEKQGGVLGAIISAIGAVSTAVMGAAKFLLGGLGKLIPGALWWVVKKIPSLLLGSGMFGGGISKGIQNLAGKAVKGIWNFGKRQVGKQLTKNVLGRAAMTVGRVAFGVVGAKVLLAGMAIYGAYRLYKYLTRNSVGSGTQGTMTKLRLLSYGYAEVNRDHYHKVLEFDMLMKDYVSNKDGKAVYKQFDKVFKDKVLELFEVKYDEKQRYSILNTWFTGRYLPAHRAFMDAYYGAGGTDYLDNLEKLSGDQVFKFATTYNLPTAVHDVKLIPIFDNATSVVSKEEIDTMLASLRQSAKKDSEEFKGKTAEQIQKETEKKAKEEAIAKKLENERLAQVQRAKLEKEKAEADKKVKEASGQSSELMGPPNPTSVVTPGPLGKEIDKTTSNGSQETIQHAEGEDKPTPTANAIAQTKPEQPLQSTINKVAAAPGPMVRDNTSLEGIKSNVAMEKIHSLDPNVKKLLAGMAKEYKDLTGKSLLVTEAYRTKADQEALRQKYGNKAAKPGTSLHEFGLAVDINSPDADALDKMGLLRKYGFTRPVGGEPWHLEPSGVATNPKLAKFDKAARENLINTSPGKGGGGLGAQGKNAPRGMQYKRDLAMQKAIYGGGSTVETMVDPAKNLPADANPPEQLANGSSRPILAAKPTITSNAGGSTTARVGSPASLQGVLTSGDGYPVRGSDGTPVSAGNPPLTRQGPLADATNRPKNSAITGPAPAYPTGAMGLDSKPSESVSTIQPNLDPGQYAKLDPEQAVIQASKVVGMDPNTMLTFAKIESSMGASAKNSKSSAKGLFQIVDKTWSYLLNKYSAKYNIPPNADKNNPYYNSLLGVAYAKENMAQIKGHKEAGIPDDIALYLAHHFGPTGGNNIIKNVRQNPQVSMQGVVSADSYKSNYHELRGKSAQQYIEYLNAKFAKAGSTSASGYGGGAQTTTDTASSGAGQQQPIGTPTPPIERSAINSPTSEPGQSPTEDYRALTKTPLFKQGTALQSQQYPLGSTTSSQTDVLTEGDDDDVINTPTDGYGYSEVTSQGPIEVRPGTVVPQSQSLPGGFNPVNYVKTALQERLSSISAMGSTPGVVVPPQPRTGFEDLSKPQPAPVSIADTIARQRADQAVSQPYQPSQAMSLDKTEALLSNMGDTLLQIKGILQAIHDKPEGMTGDKKPTEQTSPTQPSISAPMDKPPSGAAVSMSRRSLF